MAVSFAADRQAIDKGEVPHVRRLYADMVARERDTSPRWILQSSLVATYYLDADRRGMGYCVRGAERVKRHFRCG